MRGITSSTRLIDQIISVLKSGEMKVKVRDGGYGFWCGEFDTETKELTIFRNKWESPIQTLIHEVLHFLVDTWGCENNFLTEQWIRDKELEIYRNLSALEVSFFKAYLKRRGY